MRVLRVGAMDVGAAGPDVVCADERIAASLDDLIRAALVSRARVIARRSAA